MISPSPRSRHLSSPPRPFLGLPHRPPFVFVKELLSTQAGKSALCLTSFEADDPIFAGHFPGNPILPGVILTEALAQTAGIAAASGYTETEPPLFFLSAINRMKFFRPVRPGEKIRLEAEQVAQIGDLVQFAVKASVHDQPVAEGQLALALAHPIKA